MKKRVYFDTSAVIKEFNREEGSDLVDKVGAYAREGNIQIVSSVWAINEAIAVIDRLTRRPKDSLSKVEQQQIIATFAERVRASKADAAFRFAPIEHVLVTNSRTLIDGMHISPDDALHLYTAYIYDCSYFLLHDAKIVQRIKAEPIEGMQIIDLGDQRDQEYLSHQFGI